MSDTYFSNFNVINYGNTTVNTQIVDITERSVVTNYAIRSPYVYYPYDITQGQRPDQVSYSAFKDPYKSWVLYLNNQIVDPYYEWYLTDEQFVEFIRKKYGSLDSALNKVAYYRNNWSEQNSITVSGYDALTPNQKSYWEPNYSSTGSTLNYSRKKLDLTTSTNFIVAYGYSGNASFIHDEILNIKIAPSSNGQAQVIQSNSTVVMAQHIFNDAFPHDDINITSSSYIYGTDSQSNVSLTSVTFMSNNIPRDVQSYWSPVYYFDVERERNEGNRTIRVLQSNYIQPFLNNFKQLMGQ